MEELSTPSSAAARELRLADLGEVSGQLIHEINNFLNSWSLQLAVLEQLTPQFSADLQEMKQQMQPITALLSQFQRYGRADRLTAETDLRVAARKALGTLNPTFHEGTNGTSMQLMGGSGEGRPVTLTLDLPADLAKVRAHEGDLERLCRFLIRNAVRAASESTAKEVILRIAQNANSVALTVDDSGPSVVAKSLLELFEPKQTIRESFCGLEMAACRSIVRRLRGQMEARSREEGGVSILALLPTAPPNE